MTMGAVLDIIAKQLESEQRWVEIEAAYERLQVEDPAEWVVYLGELAEWEAGTGGSDKAAALEWPEYNQ
jgi:hypothetical protein